MQYQRYVLLAFFAGAVVLGISVQAGVASLLVSLQVPDTRYALFNASTIAGLLAAVASFAALIRNRRAVGFVDEVVDELLRVTWPTREETLRASTTVVFTTLFTAALIGGYDFLWKQLADVFLFTEG